MKFKFMASATEPRLSVGRTAGGVLVPLLVDEQGRLVTGANIDIGDIDILSAPFSYPDNDPLAGGEVAAMGALVDEAAPSTIAEGSIGAPRMDANRILRQLLTTPAGADAQYDDTSKLAVSLYGDGAAAGDTPVSVTNEDGTAGVIHVIPRFLDGNRMQSANNTGDSDNGARTIPASSRAWNGAAFDKLRNNVESTLLASAARTLQTDSPDQTNFNGEGLILVVDVTVDPATADITPTLQLKDSISGAYVTIWTAAAAISAVGTFTYLFQPGGAAGSYTEAVNLRIPRTWRGRIAVADGDSMTYSVSSVTLV